MMGMRLLKEGIQRRAFYERFGVDLLEIRGDAIMPYVEQGHLLLSESSLKFSKSGRFISNRILRDIV
jgi:coproporphyrinogen III oxidase-like Fe-S oxidoreductase